MSREEAEAGVEKYRERYTDGIWENKVYPGIMELLADLQQDMPTSYMATAKPEVFALRIAERFGFNPIWKISPAAAWMVKPIRKLW